MSFVTPVDGQPALASHVSQITDTLVGARSEPITLLSTLTLGTTPAAAGCCACPTPRTWPGATRPTRPT